MSTKVTIDLWLSRDYVDLIESAANDISLQAISHQSTTVATETTQANASSSIAAHHLATHLRRIGKPRSVTTTQPDATKARLTESFGLTRRYQAVSVTSPGARFSNVKVRRDIVEASALIGVSAIGQAVPPDSLAIGLWTHYIDSRLAVPLLHPSRREPDTADIVLTVFPTLAGNMLVGEHKGYVVCVWSSDLIAAELAGLAIWTAAQPTSHERFGPWEDPVVQRATELDLGIQFPTDLALRPMWVGPSADAAGRATLSELSATLSSLLNIPTS